MSFLKISMIIIAIITTIVLAFLLFTWYRSNYQSDTHDLAKRLDKHIQNAMQKEQIVGLVIGVVQGNEVFIKGYGTTQKGKQITPDSLTLFELASASKLFTTTTAQIGVSRNELNWQDKVATHVAQKVTIPTQYHNINLLHLATHTSGFPSIPQSMIDKMSDEKNPYKDLKINDLYDYLKTCKDNQPLGNYEYCNFGMGLLGHILELKYRKNYETIVKENLCAPLKMNNTTITLSPQQTALLAQGYDEEGNANPIWQDSVLTGAGSFLSNATDMVEFIKANLNPNYATISPQLIACHQPQFKGETAIGWHTSEGFMDSFLGVKGLLWHNGMAGGYASYIAIDKKTNRGIVILSNSAKDMTLLGLKLMRLTRLVSLEK